MTARTHDAIAFASLITVATLYPPGQINLLTVTSSLIANIIGCLLPDTDQAANRLWDLTPGGNETGRLLRNLFIHHRTITHSLVGVFLAYKLLEWLIPMVLNPQFINGHIVFMSMMIGYLSHLAADSITKEGLPLLFPLPWKIGIPPVKALRITTGSWVENFIVLPGVAAYLVWFIWIYQEAILQLVRSITR